MLRNIILLRDSSEPFIMFETTSYPKKLFIKIEENEKIEQLIKHYFEIIHHPELFGDPSIRFLYNAKLLSHKSKGLIKSLKINSEYYTIFIEDSENKLI